MKIVIYLTNKRFTTNNLPFTIHTLTFAFCLFTFAFLLYLPVFAQQKDNDPPADVAVPPTKFLSQDEKKLLDGEKDIKNAPNFRLNLWKRDLLNVKNCWLIIVLQIP